MRPGLEDTIAAPNPASKSPAANPATVPATGNAATIGPATDSAASVDPTRTHTAPRTQPLPTGPGLAAGQQFGHFRIERPLGAGGMGEVYLATDLALERPVAIKVLPTGSARDAAGRDRLVREARAQARVSHPNVGHIYFIGEEAGRLYFAMEYVSGETLSARVASGPLAADDALAIVRSAALGLREAQRHGITHRDIKPSNLMIDGHGMVKVLDFGLAAGALGEVTAGPVAQTSLGGTPLYMAPEQARGEPVDFRADIYALGATLYHLVSGRPPFEADTLHGLLSKHSSAQRPVLPRRAGLARTSIAAIDALCARMMAPRPADRFASYDELIRAIELASADHMRPAGLWVRLMAGFVDLIAGLIIAAAIVLPISLLLLHDANADLNDSAFLVIGLYMVVCTTRAGRTLGMWLFELEVVDVTTGGKPRWRASLVRAVIQLAVPIASALLTWGLALRGEHLVESVHDIIQLFMCWPLFALIWASLRSVAKQTIWDKASRTMVRYRSRRPATTL